MIDNDGTTLELKCKKEIELKIESKAKTLCPRWDPLRDLDGNSELFWVETSALFVSTSVRR